MRTFLTLALLAITGLSNAQMTLGEISLKTYDLISYDIQKEQVNFTCVDNSKVSLSKKDIVYIKTSLNEVITFRSGKQKVRIKGENIDPTNLATLGRIDAYRLYKTQNEPIITNPEYLQSYNAEVKKIHRSVIIGSVAAGAAFVIGLSIFLETMKDVNQLQ